MKSSRLAVDLKAAFCLLGTVLKWTGLAYAVPLGVALYFAEPSAPFALSLVIVVAVGWLMEVLLKREQNIGTREAFLVVALAWLLISLGGMLPYLFSGSLDLIDALFESMSGFTTTGATVLIDIEAETTSLLIWRSLSQWIGGLGIIVLAVAILPQLAIGGRRMLVVERPDAKITSLNPHIFETARHLWLVYLLLTGLEFGLLIVTGVVPLDALAHAFTTISTGGFSPHNRSIEEFTAMSQWVIMLFMLIGGMNFVLLYRLLRGNAGSFVRDPELKLYLVIVLVAAVFLIFDISSQYVHVEELVRKSLFQVISIVTTTGFANADFNQWDASAKLIILLLMFVGGSAGSTTGALKVMRSMIIFKFVAREFRKVIQPRKVIPVRIGKTPIDEADVNGVLVFTAVYIGLFLLGSLLLMQDLERVGGINGVQVPAIDVVSAVASSLGNVGPGFGIFGPMSNYAALPDTSKILLTLLMWIGRLEIFPVLVLLLRSYWKAF